MEKQCKAKSKQSGERCKRLPAVGREVCSIHGGKSPVGFAHHNFTDGKTSKYLGSVRNERAERIQARIEADELPTLRDNIALTDEHIRELFELLDENSMLENWNRLVSAIRVAEQNILYPESVPDLLQKEPDVCFAVINEIVERQSGNYKTWKDIRAVNEDARRLQETQAKLMQINFDLSIKQSNHVPVEYLRDTFRLLAEIFDIAPPDVRADQLRALQMRFDALPKAVQGEPKKLTGEK